MKGFQFRVLVVGILSLLLLFLPACSRTEWAVRWGDTVIAWKINNQFDFTGDARKSVKSGATELIQSARKKEFPKMAQFFKSGSQEFSGLNFNNEETLRNWVGAKFTAAEDFMDSLPQDLEPFALKIASLVQKENWQAFQKSFERENSKILKEKSKCAGKMEDELDDWLGPLSPDQREAVVKYCETRKDTPEIRVRNREHLMEVFKSWAEPKPGEFNSQLFQIAVQKWLKNYRSIQLQEADQKWKTSRQQLIQSLTQILMNSTPAQRKHFQESLEARAQSLQRLSL